MRPRQPYRAEHRLLSAELRESNGGVVIPGCEFRDGLGITFEIPIIAVTTLLDCRAKGAHVPQGSVCSKLQII